jgi:tetratricopeptide (TPR) repeat protein
LTSKNQQRKTFFTVAIGLILFAFVGAPLIPTVMGFFSQVNAPPTPAQSQVGDVTKIQQQIQGYETVLKREPNNLNALQNLVDLRLQMGQPAQAAELLERARKLNPDNPNILGALAQLRIQTGQSTQAIDLWERARKLNPADPRYTLSIGDTYLKTNQFDKASVEYDKLLAISEDYVPALVGKGNALQGMGKGKEAQVQFDKAIKVAPPEMKQKIKEIALKNAAGKTLAPSTIPSTEPSK